MTPEQLEAFRARLGWTRRQLGRELGISQDRLRRLMDGKVAIPRSIELACRWLSGNATITPSV
jgi:transcriptional regulator with XRE-family HTH domain